MAPAKWTQAGRVSGGDAAGVRLTGRDREKADGEEEVEKKTLRVEWSLRQEQSAGQNLQVSMQTE